MTEPEWLEPQLAEQFHKEQLTEHGGMAGVRDFGGLQAALSRPHNVWAYESADLFRLAAVYAHGIATGHPFIDGNKRTSFVVSLTFLAINGVWIDGDEEEAFALWTQLAEGKIGEAEIAAWMKANAVSIA